MLPLLRKLTILDFIATVNTSRICLCLTKGGTRVECYIDLGTDEKTDAAFEALRQKKEEIELAFNSSLRWDKTTGRARRIYAEVDGGWDTPETGWPALQDSLIETMGRLETALKNPILAL